MTNKLMAIELTQDAKEKILQQIAKRSGKLAFRVAICVAIALFIFFFIIGGPPRRTFMIFGDIFAMIVVTLLSAAFTYVITGNRQADKYGLRDPSNTHLSDEPAVNPASGLAMIGGVDTGGNGYGCGSTPPLSPTPHSSFGWRRDDYSSSLSKY